MKWKCSRCQTENKDVYICSKCGFDESRNYMRYSSITVLQEKDKADFKKLFFKGDNVLMACPDITSVFGKTMDRRKIKSIQIYNTLSLAGELAWDVSAHKDGSVLAWLTEEDPYGLMHLYLAADGNIVANKNCENLFSYDMVERIEGLQYLNTENVMNMSGMFCGCKKVQELNVSGFDTRNVIDMGSMFSLCSKVQKINVSGFDTRNVTDMGWMFFQCQNVQEIDVSGFDTKYVTNMKCVFYGCKKVQKLNVSGFDTKNVRNMSHMFYDCLNVQEINVGGFDTRNVIDKDLMFGYK